MPVKLKWPWLGIAIPSFLVSYIGYTSHFFILSNYIGRRRLLAFQLALSMIWISYVLAIKSNPGKPPSNFSPREGQWRNYCRRCNNFKPERTHHCKTCDQCVLVMDHHCPWTMNCVGHRNFAHFMRFLFWVIFTTSYLGVMLGQRILDHWHLRNSHAFVHTTELCFLAINTPLNAFVWLTMIMLFVRCVNNQILNGMTQIESWEMERIENLLHRRRLIPQLLVNLREFYPNSELTGDDDKHRLNDGRKLPVEDIVCFPYDLTVSTNACTFMGPFYSWLLPWGQPAGDGVNFETNEIATYEPESPLEDRFMSLPWPPDGGRQKSENVNLETASIAIHSSRGEAVLKKRPLPPRLSSQRKEWQNEWGESLADFGVDVDA
ncbi:LANO_0A06524g1_1 [Lachancea nothofagi CBS 11611]|uniref:Palmitoyltransferase PFA4 n=1 Tax=Lachancea nothofagi CBS 11611 TaxID=1266666 RepID=A0A1G4IRP1_9SACH|nr:LANO_0A06524g1_1 [Lachancea nothofagi CBS 11611]